MKGGMKGGMKIEESLYLKGLAPSDGRDGALFANYFFKKMSIPIRKRSLVGNYRRSSKMLTVTIKSKVKHLFEQS